MRHDGFMNRTSWYLSFLLGQTSALLGLTLTLGWLFALAVTVPPRGFAGFVAPRLALPIEPPLIGLVLGGLGLLIARAGRQPIGRYSVAGMVLNALPLVTAVGLVVLRSSMH